MASAMAKACDMTNADVICHVPLHDKRRKSRGFDQAEELAKRLSGLTGKPFVHAIKRVRHTPTQTKLSAAERQENVRGAFESLCPISGRIALVATFSPPALRQRNAPACCSNQAHKAS